MRKFQGLATYTGLAVLAGTLAYGEMIDARSIAPGFRGGGGGLLPGDVHASTAFQLLDPPANQSRGARPLGMVTLAGSELSAVGPGLVITDTDNGDLVLADSQGREVDRLHIGKKLGQLAVDRKAGTVYVADRSGDRVVIVDARFGLKRVGAVATPREPYGLALTPKGDSLLVTTVADRTLVALDTANRNVLWRKNIGREARGVAVSPSGKKALVTYLTTSAVAEVDLSSRKLRHIPLGRQSSIASLEPVADRKDKQNRRFGNPKHETINTFARNAYAAQYLSSDLVIVPFQRSTPVQRTDRRERRGSYGGGSAPPVVHRIAFIGGGRQLARAHVNTHIPRALAYDSKSDTLFLAGMGNDVLMAIGDASKATIHRRWQVSLKKGAQRCGPSALDVAPDGRVFAKCELSRQVAMVGTKGKTSVLNTISMLAKVQRTGNRPPKVIQGKRPSSSHRPPQVAWVETLGKTSVPEKVRQGRALFFTGGDSRLSGQGALACASCHAEGRTDGLSWRIEGHTLQTPLLAGRLVGTHPFKWDGKDPDLKASLTNTVRRLGGRGLKTEEIAQLRAFVESLEPPRAPTPKSTAAVARGKKLFASKTLGCASCHSGKSYSDGKHYDLAQDLNQVDTPSLVGLSQSAPYYHDGSAATLRSLLMENGSIHAMGQPGNMSSGQIGDLVAYLETL